MTRQEYFYECARLSGVMGERSDAIEAFKAKTPNLLDDSVFEEFSSLQDDLGKAIGEWQRFCDTHRGRFMGYK